MNRISKYLSVIFIFLLVVFASGCVIPGNFTGNNGQEQNATPSPDITQPTTNNSSFATDVVIAVAYQGSWNGTISDNTGNRTVQGNANDNYNLGPNPGTVSVTFQKTDNSTFPLEVRILQGSNVIESQSTNETNGSVSISHVF